MSRGTCFCARDLLLGVECSVSGRQPPRLLNSPRLRGCVSRSNEQSNRRYPRHRDESSLQLLSVWQEQLWMTHHSRESAMSSNRSIERHCNWRTRAPAVSAESHPPERGTLQAPERWQYRRHMLCSSTLATAPPASPWICRQLGGPVSRYDITWAQEAVLWTPVMTCQQLQAQSERERTLTSVTRALIRCEQRTTIVDPGPKAC